jgi:hypothetical protein
MTPASESCRAAVPLVEEPKEEYGDWITFVNRYSCGRAGPRGRTGTSYPSYLARPELTVATLAELTLALPAH